MPTDVNIALTNDRSERPLRGTRRFIERIKDAMRDFYEDGLGDAGVRKEVQAALRELERRNEQRPRR